MKVMTVMLEINQLSESNAKSFWDLRLRALKERPDVFGVSYEEEKGKSLESIAARFQNTYIPPEENFILGAYVDNELIGMVGFYQEKRIKIRHKGTIWGVYVIPKFRRQGIGKKLMLSLIDRIKLLPELEQIYLSVATSNKEAQNLYKSLGFKSYGLDKKALKLDSKYIDEENMVLFL